MQGLRVWAAVGAISLCGGGVAHADTEVTRFNANGNTATHNSFDGTAALDLSVNKNDQGASSTTFLSFSKQVCDADGCTGTFGFGNIPNADFSAGGGTARLTTNLAAIPGFQVFTFVQDLVNGTFTQTPTTGGVIVIDWRSIPRQSSSSTGTSTFVSGAFSNRFTGQQSSDRARSTGSLFGAPIPTESSSLIGVARSSQIIISRS
jgi:hypothetical protein